MIVWKNTIMSIRTACRQMENPTMPYRAMIHGMVCVRTTERKKTVAMLAVAAGSLWWHSSPALGAGTTARGLPDVDYRRLVSRADLHYDKPVSRSEEGIPVGNGRMGSLVRTTPEAIRLQINRVDVFANNSYSTSFPARNSDYCGGCGFVDISFGGECRLRNPWPDATVTLHRDGERAEDLRDSVLAFPTRKGETIVLLPGGTTPSSIKVP
jgi:hypothetical protein